MRWLCLFFQCNWVWRFNASNMPDDYFHGVYQCKRCKTISVGSPR